MLITFSGMDGAGKSTQIDLLEDKLRQNGFRCKKIWARGGYTPGFELLKKLVRLILGRSAIPQGKSAKRTKVISKPAVARVWLILAMLDLIVLYAIYMRFQLILGKKIICDRYVEDTYIDFMLNFPQIDFEKMLLWKVLVFSAPRPTLAILLLLPVAISMKRSKEKNEPYPDSEATLEKRLEQYTSNEAMARYKYLVLYGKNSIEQNFSSIVSEFNALGYQLK